MTARLSEPQTKPSNGSATQPAQPPHLRLVSQATKRVMSVSPRAVSDETENGSGEASRNVFLTPRVLDQQAFDQFATELRRLLDDAEASQACLAQDVSAAQSMSRQMNDSTSQLQERLRLGARMLKAFQSQIVRIESAISDLALQEQRTTEATAQLDACAATLDERMRSAADRFEEQLNVRLEQALVRVDEGIVSRTEKLDRLGSRIDCLAPAAENLASIVEQAESNIVAVGHRQAALVKKFDEQEAEARSIIEQCRDATRQLGQNLLDGARRVDELSEETVRIEETLSKKRQECCELEARLTRRLAEVKEASSNLDIDVQTCEALESLVEELAPWKDFVFEQDKSKSARREIPRPLLNLAGQLEARVDKRLAAFSTAMRTIAMEIDRLAQRDEANRNESNGQLNEPVDSNETGRVDDDADTGMVSVMRPSASVSRNAISSS